MSTEVKLSAAQNIVNQLADLWNVPVDVRQATNDRADKFVSQFFPAPVLDRAEAREVIRKALNTALFNAGHPAASTGWSPSEEVDKAVDDVMKLARPIPTREEIAKVLHDHVQQTVLFPHEWQYAPPAIREEFLSQADVVLALLKGPCTCDCDADVTPAMRTETGQHLTGCPQSSSGAS